MRAMQEHSAAGIGIRQDPGQPRLLRFLTCGSVDDGKSTLIGRLLWETKAVYDDHAAALARDSRRYGTQGGNLDFALLVDGLQAEREQGITIDVAYRFFSTRRRRFVVADTPGHEQYTCNMATGASTADLAVILVDARKGVLVQTRRHSRIVRMLGIRRVVVAVNKMDQAGWRQEVYAAIERDYRDFADALGFELLHFVPMSALHGDNVVSRSDRTPWYDGGALLPFLERVEVTRASRGAFRMPVQWVSRPHPDFRGFCGRVASGTIRPGDRVVVLPSGAATRVRSIETFGGPLEQARPGESVTLRLADELEASRGSVIADTHLESADQFEAQLLWMSAHELAAGRLFTAKINHRQLGASVTAIKHRVDVNTGGRLAARSLAKNEIAVVNVRFDDAVPFEPYASNPALGAFILVDRLTKETVGAGMIDFALRRAANVHWQAIDVTPQARQAIKGQRARCFWFTGLSASGKSTLANMLDKRLHAAGLHTFVLDGDNLRHGLNRDLGFTEADRVENVRRVAEVAKLMVNAGLIVLVSFISPFRSERAFARSLFGEGDFIEVFVDAPLEVCELRDPKGLYAKARAGALKNFTGLDSPYEPPESPEITVKTAEASPAAAAEQLARLAMKAA